jgi:hypothetical protein
MKKVHLELVSCPGNKFQKLSITVVQVQSHLAHSVSILGARRLTPKILNVARKRPWTCPNYGRYCWDSTLEYDGNKQDENRKAGSLSPTAATQNAELL